MGLDLHWVERIHARLLVRYGTRWTSMYAGIDPELVKADWSEHLSGMSGESINYALKNLPDDFPPNAAQFRRIGSERRYGDSGYIALTYKPDPPSPEVIAKLKKLANDLRVKF